ncbi:hypothetical protein COY16_04980 [Candidatus Roizmanbacteria bacterium CG_4_10_14_0_2_um_filter_39_13]|uniref:DUF5659 domain-containing protein n=1 Tax=Candidatus Roizmanbacteria bacterium CG_4_10_14_0_2_um_filter_39_13 TaxID=1974825 RepID=A0A2M7TWJ2_9BACT|nr:MAG: hypothetical protein COY16_04980 [Candidatus Roizmanbacteria bacterium CG_4_10_14_0_2_um_filter_39_13]
MENTYRTKDLASAAMLIVKGHPMLQMEREAEICFFIFSSEQECERLSDQFFFGEVLVNARDYYEAMNRLKNKIFSYISYGKSHENTHIKQ